MTLLQRVADEKWVSHREGTSLAKAAAGSEGPLHCGRLGAG